MTINVVCYLNFITKMTKTCILRILVFLSHSCKRSIDDLTTYKNQSKSRFFIYFNMYFLSKLDVFTFLIQDIG